ncbi:MAG: hypothetical protein M3R46_16965 [Actinomycetota bacterium]|jgi:hypothetical protein|nr:hypothetical protein [Actinomycetota bacterium]
MDDDPHPFPLLGGHILEACRLRRRPRALEEPRVNSPVLVTLGPRGPLLARRHLPCLRFGADVGIGTERGVGVTQAPRGTVK